jgi:glycosyltransferase involved in cell wall biosynthesis
MTDVSVTPTDQTRRGGGPAEQPAVSVIIAVYNGEPYLRSALNSVLSQDFEDFEVVIVDDCSTDCTAEIIAACGDPRILYIRNTRNLGQTASLNVGLAAAAGELVARMDADDRYLSGKLRRQVEYMRAHPDVAVCGTWARRVDERDRLIGTFSAPLGADDIAFELIVGTPVCHVSAVMRASALRQVGGYDEQLRYAADIALWSVLHERGYVIRNIPEVLMEYREHSMSYGASNLVDGAAGREAAEITRLNAKRIAHYTLSAADARSIRLRTVPGARLTYDDKVACYVQLREIAQRVYGRRAARVHARIFGSLVWSLVGSDARSAPAVPSKRTPRARGIAVQELAARAIARFITLIGPRARGVVKELVRARIS